MPLDPRPSAPASAPLRRPAARRRGAVGPAPRLVFEASLHAQGFPALAGVDEVGRGALSGPVTVGVVVVTQSCGRPPAGLRDSKLLTPSARRLLVPRIQRWASAFAIGHASPAEIDDLGLIAALRLAGHRALGALGVTPDCILLDGNHDYLTPQGSVLHDVACDKGEMAFRLGGEGRAGEVEGAPTLHRPFPRSPLPSPLSFPRSFPQVHTRVRADEQCASVAAASVLAKTTRDALMGALAQEDPRYGWEVNKGYGTKAHRAAIGTHGPTLHHRRSWKVFEDFAAADGDSEDRGGPGDPGTGAPALTFPRC